MQGWIKLNRSITQMPGYIGERFGRAQCWIDLLLLAAWRDKTLSIKGSVIPIKRGELIVAETELAQRWGMARNTMRTRLKEMIDDGRITIEKVKGKSRIRIIHYEEYQSFNFLKDNPPTDPKPTQHEQSHDTNNDSQFLQEMKNDNTWQEVICMRFHISQEELIKKLELFSLDLQCCDKHHQSLQDAKAHFVSWLRIKINIKEDIKMNKRTILPEGMVLEADKMNFDKSTDW